MTLHLHHATGTDALAEALADLLAEPLEDPFAEEVVVVPAKGVERWLTQRLSHRLGAGVRGGDGVCAGVRFLNPRSLVALLTGTERDDPWDPDRLVWPLLEVVDGSLDEPWCATLAQHLGHRMDTEEGELRRDRRYSVVRRLAGLFASYAVQRPSVLEEWSAGRDTDGSGPVPRDLPRDLAWQPQLWRRLVAVVDRPSPVERHRATLDAIGSGAPLALPTRLSMFGHTRLPVTELELLRAVGEVREVHLWLPQASPAAWAALADDVATGPVPRAEDRAGERVRHPLLSALGRDSRELQRSLAVLGPVRADSIPGRAEDAFSLLRLLQEDLRHDRLGDATARTWAEGDRSVQVHACHGATRQVEVLREVLVGLLEDDPTLEPRDILVLCPDVEAYAPLFSAAFGLADVPAGPTPEGPAGTAAPRHPAHRLRVRLADRGLMSTNPLFAVAGALVALAGGRGTASEVLDLVATDPVRHRFDLDDDDVATITGWVEQAGVRWGLTEELRRPFRLDDFGQNTWRAGLDRVVLGVAMAEQGGHLGGTLPLDDVGSGSVDLAGRLVELVDRLEAAVERLRAATTPADWMTGLRDGVLAVGSTRPADAWQVAQLERELDAVTAAGSGGDGVGPTLRLADVRTLVDLRLQPRPTRANFRTGSLTVATLVPMRSVPHRVVCLVGLDDGVFPRSTVSDGDDVLARSPRTGERDPRSEDRQLLLDAVLAAQETLVVTYTGANEHSGQERPPAVPLGELLDGLDRTVAGARARVLVRHPLQPFDRRNFEPAVLSGVEAFSFDRAFLEGARAATAPRTPRPALLPGPLPRRHEPDVTLADLQSFFAHPVRGFLRQRLDVGVPQDFDEVADAIPVELDALGSWAIGDRILRQAIEGADPEQVFLAEQLRGDLPPLRLGDRVLGGIADRVNKLYLATAAARSLPARPVDVTVDLGDGRRLTGVVGDVRGNRIVRVHYSSLSPKHRLASWLDLLALSAGLPDQSWTAATVGWHRTSVPQLSLAGPLDHAALDHLRALVDVFDRGLREPLPLPLRTGHAWADALRARRDPKRSAEAAWTTRDGSPVPGECEDPSHVRVFGRGAPLDDLLVPARDDEGWNDQPHRLGRLAVRVWQPLFDHEQVRQA